MKLLKSLVLVVAASLMMTACGGGGAKPSDVAKSFLEATMKFDFAAAKKYVAKDLQESFDKVAEQFNSPEMQGQIEMLKTLAGEAKFEIISEEIAEDGNTATVKVKTTGMGQEQEQNIPLVKEDGEWKINEGAGM